MYKIHCYTENAERLFNYNSDIIPLVGDIYPQPCGNTGSWEVTKRILHTQPDCPNVISLWLKPTNK